MADFAELREHMVRTQIVARGIHDRALLAAFRGVAREAFVDARYADQAYGDHPLPIEAGQTISQPYIVALMIDAAGVSAGDRVLEIGAGSGYAAAVIGRIAAKVVAIERHRELAQLAAARIERLGFDNIRIIEGDGTGGYPDEAPYDAIVAAASGRHVPKALIEQLAPAGRIVMPLGDPGGVQELVKVTKGRSGKLLQESLCAVRFVPLIGAQGWIDPQH